MSERKVTKKGAGGRGNCWLWRSSDFRSYTVGHSPHLPGASVHHCYLCCSHRWVTSNDWGGRASGKGGGLWSATQRNKLISAQITTPRYTVSSSDWTKLCKTKDSAEGIRGLLEITKGLFGMTQHWKHNCYTWFVDTAYITYLIVGRSGKMSCINIELEIYRSFFFL